MLRHDLVNRVSQAHDNAVKAYGRWLEATPGTRTKEALWTRYENAEHKFDSAMAALVDDGNRRR